jgi:hypothetical protein
MEEPNNDIDTETLQAQIDLAMAQAQNLIASWLPGSSGSLTQSSSRTAEAEAELQAILRRPPRLGVGAPLPETHAPAQARLVQKLQGGKKRTREIENGVHAGVKKKEDEMEESSAEESRVGTTRKRTIVDPFDVAGKKKKKRRKETDETAQADGQTAHESATDASMVPTPKKKKRKKKNHLPEGQGIEEHDGEPQAAHTHNAIAAQVVEGKKPLRQEFQDGASEASDTDLVAVPGSGATSPPTSPRPSLPGNPIQRSPTGAISNTVDTILPVPHILNLTGPPSVAPEATESPLRKKRRRKKKKKKPATDPP